MRELIISPSILALDYAQMSEQLDELKKSKATWLHFDVMDFHFVPNLTFGPDILKGVKKRTGLFMDVHIMVAQPKAVAKTFIDAGADLITFHYEACADENEARELCLWIQAQGCKAGISIKPKTPVSVLAPLLDVVDLVLIMSVEPGFGGQSFMFDMVDKIAQLHAWKQERNLSFDLQVDGGITDETARPCVAAGANVLVAGSYVFKAGIHEPIERLLSCAASY
ncbi:MAG: ribulose-phosphate 3-epimerase [Erysipelotrichaceae bacterium]